MCLSQLTQRTKTNQVFAVGVGAAIKWSNGPRPRLLNTEMKLKSLLSAIWENPLHPTISPFVLEIRGCPSPLMEFETPLAPLTIAVFLVFLTSSSASFDNVTFSFPGSDTRDIVVQVDAAISTSVIRLTASSSDDVISDTLSNSYMCYMSNDALFKGYQADFRVILIYPDDRTRITQSVSYV